MLILSPKDGDDDGGEADAKDDDDDSTTGATAEKLKVALPAILARTMNFSTGDNAADDEDAEEDQEMTEEDRLTQAAARLISTHVTFIADTGGGDSQLAEKVAATAAGSYQCKEHGVPMGKGTVLMLFDPANMTETTSHPHLRKAQVSQQMVDRVINVGSMARAITRTGTTESGSCDDNQIVCGEDLWLIFDGGRQIQTTLMKPFKRFSSKMTLNVVLTYDEDAVLANIGRVTTMTSLRCTENMYLVAAEGWSVPRKSHLHYKGSNYSDQLGPIVVDSWDADSTWSLSRKEKKGVMGRYRVDTGGAVDSGLSSTSKWKTKETEPVWFHAKPYLFAEEIVYSYIGKAIVDFSPSSGHFAMVAMRKRLPYCGVTCTEVHSEELLKHLLVRVKAAMVDKDDPLFKPEFDVQTTPATKRQKIAAESTGKSTGDHTGDGDKSNKRKGQHQSSANKKDSAGKDVGSEKKNLMSQLQKMMAGEDGNGAGRHDWKA
jgi:hypothetical protein